MRESDSEVSLSALQSGTRCRLASHRTEFKKIKEDSKLTKNLQWLKTRKPSCKFYLWCLKQ
jgi:hypothetical protein